MHVLERSPPEGEEPVEWVLLTSRRVESAAEAWGVVDDYRARWLVEQGFDAWKNGCGVDKLRQRRGRTLLNALFVRLPVAWEILAMRQLARHAPGAPARAVVDELEEELLREQAPGGLEQEATVGEASPRWRGSGGIEATTDHQDGGCCGGGGRGSKEMARGARAFERARARSSGK